MGKVIKAVSCLIVCASFVGCFPYDPTRVGELPAEYYPYFLLPDELMAASQIKQYTLLNDEDGVKIASSRYKTPLFPEYFYTTCATLEAVDRDEKIDFINVIFIALTENDIHDFMTRYSERYRTDTFTPLRIEKRFYNDADDAFAFQSRDTFVIGLQKGKICLVVEIRNLAIEEKKIRRILRSKLESIQSKYGS